MTRLSVCKCPELVCTDQMDLLSTLSPSEAFVQALGIGVFFFFLPLAFKLHTELITPINSLATETRLLGKS